MPTYQYSCTECGHFFEQFQSFSEDSLTVCPQCQGRLRKVFNAVGVVFKGSGFYRTDSRSASEKGDGASSGGGGGSAEKTSKPAGDGGSRGDGGSTGGGGGSGSNGSGAGTASATPAASGSSTSAA